MCKRLILYFDTIKYLKVTQIYYQILHRIKTLYSVDNLSFSKFEQVKINYLTHNFNDYFSDSKLGDDGTFTILNKSKQFSAKVDWNYMGLGKLWNFKLQYLDYLWNNAVSDEQRTFILNDISNEIKSNKLKLEAFPVSQRIIQYAFLLHYVKLDRELERVFKCQLGYLDHNCEYHLQANHLLENYIALYLGSLYLDENTFHKKYFYRLSKELNIQIALDGAHYEGSIMYHSQILYKLLLLINILRTNQLYPEEMEAISTFVSKMFAWYQHITKNGLLNPILGDTAKSGSIPFEIIQAEWKKFDFPDQACHDGKGNYFLMEQNDMSIIFNIGDVYPAHQPGHQHADLLHFVFYKNGNCIFADTGISTYENTERRRYERSTAAHNTVCINGKNQSEVWAAFRMGKRAKIVKIEFGENEMKAEIQFGTNQHHIHKRRCYISEGLLEIQDEVIGTNNNEINFAYFHLDYSVDVEKIINDLEYRLQADTRIVFDSGQVEIEAYQQAIDFNQLQNAQRFKVSFKSILKTKIYWS
ncbi:MAG: heparinase II/III family protein [Bacteroidota bacterium]|nr:heparinase II/III family protein [Bacteroidota bacterium]